MDLSYLSPSGSLEFSRLLEEAVCDFEAKGVSTDFEGLMLDALFFCNRGLDFGVTTGDDLCRGESLKNSPLDSRFALNGLSALSDALRGFCNSTLMVFSRRDDLECLGSEDELGAVPLTSALVWLALSKLARAATPGEELVSTSLTLLDFDTVCFGGCSFGLVARAGLFVKESLILLATLGLIFGWRCGFLGGGGLGAGLLALEL